MMARTDPTEAAGAAGRRVAGSFAEGPGQASIVLRGDVSAAVDRLELHLAGRCRVTSSPTAGRDWRPQAREVCDVCGAADGTHWLRCSRYQGRQHVVPLGGPSLSLPAVSFRTASSVVPGDTR